MSSTFPCLPGVPLVESPFFPLVLDNMGLSDAERAIAVALNRDGYATFDFPDADIDARIDRIVDRLGRNFGTSLSERGVAGTGENLRLQDAWFVDEDVRAIACNEAVLALLSKPYGRQAFPFQTLNFPVGTQQAAHSDSVHFSSLPERFMCGVWLALEEYSCRRRSIALLSGVAPLAIPSNAMLGRTAQDNDRNNAQGPFEPYWQAMIEAKQCPSETFLARKGQALIWAANLLHGGSMQNDLSLTRWSQVTHYYFKDCIYYTPAFSDEPLGKLDLRHITNIATAQIEPNRYMGNVVESPLPSDDSDKAGWREKRRMRELIRNSLPQDFGAEGYYRLNPDVALARLDAGRHYILHGIAEGRRYKF